MRPERVTAFAPGRINLIGEHTDYNDGLALAFAIARGVTVDARRTDQPFLSALALDLGEEDSFALDDRSRSSGWRAFVRGTVAELQARGLSLVGAELEIAGDVPRGAGLSSSAALEVALCIALLVLGGHGERGLDRTELARLCSRVENEWVGAETGLLDQLASLYGECEVALLIDFFTLKIEQVPLRLDEWKLVVVDSGERHTHGRSGYNDRRRECRRICELLGVRSLREVSARELEQLPEPLGARAKHVLTENDRVMRAVDALRAGQCNALGQLLNASHASLRDCYEVSTPAVERTVQGLLAAGAAGARLIGGGFGGSVLGLFAPSSAVPEQALEVRPGRGAHVIL